MEGGESKGSRDRANERESEKGRGGIEGEKGL